MILLDEIDSSLRDLKKRSLLRKRVVVNSRRKNQININGKWLINFASNDYLGLSQNGAIKKAIINGIKKYGSDTDFLLFGMSDNIRCRRSLVRCKIWLQTGYYGQSQ